MSISPDTRYEILYFEVKIGLESYYFAAYNLEHFQKIYVEELLIKNPNTDKFLEPDSVTRLSDRRIKELNLDLTSEPGLIKPLRE